MGKNIDEERIQEINKYISIANKFNVEGNQPNRKELINYLNYEAKACENRIKNKEPSTVKDNLDIKNATIEYLERTFVDNEQGINFSIFKNVLNDGLNTLNKLTNKVNGNYKNQNDLYYRGMARTFDRIQNGHNPPIDPRFPARNKEKEVSAINIPPRDISKERNINIPPRDMSKERNINFPPRDINKERNINFPPRDINKERNINFPPRDVSKKMPNTPTSTSRTDRAPVNTYFSDTNQIRNLNNQNNNLGYNQYIDISKGHQDSQNSKNTLQRANPINSNVSATPRRSPSLGG